MSATRVFLFLCAAILVAAIGIRLTNRKSDAPVAPLPIATTAAVQDARNTTYVVDGEAITLKAGVFESTIEGSAATMTTSYFGNEAKADLNGDGLEDVAFILTQSGGGSGTFYYVAAALKTSSGYKGTDAIFLGDRIVPATTEIKGATVVANFTERAKGEPMAAEPSVATSTYAKIISGVLTQVPKP